MMHTLITIGLIAGSLAANACSCFGPQTFCGTMYPTGPNPEWWEPDAVILGVKLGDYQHGMDVKVVQSFGGTLSADDTVRVWGDCGLLCRHYPTTWAVGDTVVWAFRLTDMAGNSLCGTNYEQAGDHMISICGTYWLEYEQGVVSGQITAETPQSMTLAQFIQTLEGCMPMGLNTPAQENDLTVQYDGAVPVLSVPGMNEPMEMVLSDMHGRIVRTRTWNGGPWRVEDPAPGTYVVRVTAAGRNWSCRIVVRE